MIKKIFPVLGFALITIIFFWQFFIKGLLPIPTDTIVGLYYPYRDYYAKTYPNGVPFKNFLITDPVRQQYPWRSLSIESYKNLEIPSWNQYTFSGTPGLANFQSAVFYPFNILFFIFSFEISWSLLIMLQPFLAGIFLYLYLRNLKLDGYSSFFGGVIFAFSGFFAMWLEWGTLLHTALWLPLILLSIDKICLKFQKLNLNKINLFSWMLVFVAANLFSIFAGHLQTFFYLLIFEAIYIFLRIYQNKNKLKLLFLFFISGLVFTIISLIQTLPTLKFIFLSGRNSEEVFWQIEGWFIPYKHLIQFFIPDFFGNPSTLNYWGTWNYGELTGFIGIVGIVFALFAIFFRRDKKTSLLILALISTLVVALPNPISKLPFIFNFPFISTSQPTRILFITDFSLSILAALGLNYFIYKGKLKQILTVLIIVGLVFILSFVFVNYLSTNIDSLNLSVARRNIFVPGIILLATFTAIILHLLLNKRVKNYFIFVILTICILELFRFSWKFNTFAKKEYLYPDNEAIKFIQKNIGNSRIATTDPRILAPNFSLIHSIKTVEGYDPLYIDRYGELIAAINRNEPDINPPFGFNRIIRVERFDSTIIDLLGIKYVLSLSELNVKGFKKVFEQGSTTVYENEEVLPEAFFVKNLIFAKNKNEAISNMFARDFDPANQAIVEEKLNYDFSLGSAEIIKNENNKIIIKTKNQATGFLVLMDSYYPTWHVKINGKEDKIYRTNFNFRGVIVPKGENEIIFENKLL